MFLTKKSLRKILIMAICYFAIGSIAIIFELIFASIGVADNFLLILGLITYILGLFFAICGFYAEGKGKLINLGNKLVRKELKPAEFLKEYENIKNSKDLVINKPSIEVLQLVSTAYDSLNDKENVLLTADEIIEAAKDKKKTFANLLKVSFLFSFGEKEEAELLFNETQKVKLDMMSSVLTDAIMKTDRAMAMGDYKIVEANSLKMLERSFPKLDNLGKLLINYTLGEVYEKLEENEKAVFYYNYCSNFGGETAIKESAKEKLEQLNLK